MVLVLSWSLLMTPILPMRSCLMFFHNPFLRSSRPTAPQGLSDANGRTRKAAGELLDQSLGAVPPHGGRRAGDSQLARA